MKRQAYYPVRIGDQLVWLRNIKTKLPNHTTALALDAGDVTAFLLDVDTAIFAMDNYRGAIESGTLAAYQRIDDALYNEALSMNIAWLGISVPAGAPAAVAYGVIKRIFDYINNTIKKADNYDMAIGADLGVEGSVVAPPDPTIAPEFTLRHTTGGKLEVLWLKGVFDGVKMEFDIGGGVIQSDFDLSPNYTLNWLPPAGTVSLVRVRMRYFYKGVDFGNWSAWQNWTLTNA